MPKLYVDNKPFEVPKGKNILEACLSLGFDLPYFCWHPAMGSVGACRQCAVKQFKDKDDDKGKVVMSCMQPVTDETFVSIEDKEAKDFRKHVIEWLMTNHPHDCPTCDEGGECHLQDMTVMTGHNYRRYRFNKRTYRNQDLGPCINHEMNRCIQCYRCVRFYRDYAGGEDLDAFSAHNHVYFGRHEDGTLQNPFSGNLVEVCPTGVFTDKTLKRHYTRKWDLTNAPSICQQCSLGCNIIPGERYGGLRRIQSRYNGEVNGYFICDRGRFGYEFVNSEKRIRHGRIFKQEEGHMERRALEVVLKEVGRQMTNHGNVIGISSPRASLESNFALRSLVGEENFYAGMPDIQLELTTKIYQILKNGPAKTPSLRQTEKADAILILGEDVTNTAPMLTLALRQSSRERNEEVAQQKDIPAWHDLAVRTAAQGERSPMFILSPGAEELEDISTHIPLSPEEIGQFAFALANELDGNAPFNDQLSKERQKQVKQIAETLKKAKQPLIVSGTSLQSSGIVEGAANVANALCTEEKQAWLSYIVPDANSLGLAMMKPKPISEINMKLKGDDTVTLIMENDLHRMLPEAEADQIFEESATVVALDHTRHRGTDKSDIIIPVGSFAESDGTLINNEGRGQRFYQVMQPKGEELESWRILEKLKHIAGRSKDSEKENLDDLTLVIIKEMPQFSGIETIAPPAGFRENGQPIPRQPHRYSGRTAMNANKNIHEQEPPEDPDTPLKFSMEGYRGGQPPSSLIPHFWSPGWNSQQSINKYQIEVGGPLHGGDPGVRLLEPEGSSTKEYFELKDRITKPAEDGFVVVPAHQIFGSEYFSMQSPAIIERSREGAFTISKTDADKLGLGEEVKVIVQNDEMQVKLPLRVRQNWPQGVIGYPMGYPGIPFMKLPTEAKIKSTEK